MPKSLFETLAGYESPAGTAAGESDLLGGPAAAPADPLWAERTEEQFATILERVQKAAEDNPEAVAQKMADAFGVDPKRFQEYLAQAQKALEQSKESTDLLGAGAAEVDYEEKFGHDEPELLGAPPDFSRSYIRQHVAQNLWNNLEEIDLDPKSSQFEDDSALGVIGWILFNGLEAVKVPRSLEPPFREQFGRIPGAEPFRRHNETNPYVYSLAAPAAGNRTRVALFADFGTGLGHARFIARQIAQGGYDAAVHLGDVYYTGTPKQYDEYFAKPLQPVVQNGIKLYVIPDNHDGYCGFHAYTSYIDNLLTQQGSYFAIETEHVQFIGVDTIWHSDRGRITDAGVRTWLEGRFKAGRDAGRTNVLLTGHEPYEYGEPDLTALNDDVLLLAGNRLDLWFWGNTHYAAFFGPRTDGKTPYFGSCIGHAGYPYATLKKEDGPKSAAPVLWAELGSRYEPTQVRKDRGMNGFCSFEIEPNGDVELRYLDWRGQERCTVRFGRQPNGRLQLSGGGVSDLTA